MRTSVIALAVGLTIAPLAARSQTPQAPQTPPSVAGTWELAAKTDHGDMTLQLVLAQDGDAVSGTLVTPHGDLAVEGEVANREIQLHGAQAESDLTIVMKLTEEGAATGSLTSGMGDATFTGKRKVTAP